MTHTEKNKKEMLKIWLNQEKNHIFALVTRRNDNV